MIEKIKSALKIKYPNLGFSDEAFNGVASLASITVTEESQIAEVVEKLKPALTGFQSDVDRRVNGLNGEKTKLESEKLELEEKLKGINPKSKPEEGEPDGQLAEQLKSMQETLEGLTAKQAQDKQRQDQSALRESAKKLMVKQGVDESSCDVTLGLMDISDGDDAESLAGKGVDKFNSLQKHFIPDGVKPRMPQGGGMGDEDFNKTMDRIAEQSGI